MTQKQQRFLLERLDAAKSTKPRHWDAVNVVATAAVLKARQAKVMAEAVIKKFDGRVRAAQDKRNLAISDGYIAAKKAILFGEPKAALKAVEAFEKRKF